MLIKELIIEFMEYYRPTIPNFIFEFNILKLDKEGFVFVHKDSQVKMKISFSDLRDDEAPDLFCETELLGLIDKNRLEEDNEDIVFFDSGFHSRGFSYTELRIKYETVLEIDPFFIKKFTIGDIGVEISDPSSLYKLIYNNEFKYYPADLEEHHSDYFTVKIKNCIERKLEEILQQIMFWLVHFMPDEYKMEGDFPKVSEFGIPETYYFTSIENERLDSGHFQPSNYDEPIAFYNMGVKTNESIYYYRVLEFFFNINHEIEKRKLIQGYNQDEDIDEYLKKMDNLHEKREEKSLINLVENINGISEVIEKAREYHLVNSAESSSFAKRLYKYRNSFVHSKSDHKNEINVPQILQIKSEDKHWRILLKKLAEMVIEQFCFDSQSLK